MITREWIINGPELHVVQIECRFLAGDVILRVDGAPHANWSIWSSSAPSEPVVINGVSYSLARIPGLRGRYEFLPTELVTLLPQPQHLRRSFLLKAVVAIGLSVAALVAAENARHIVRWCGLPWQYEPLATMYMTGLSVFFAALFVLSAYRYVACQRSARDSGRSASLPPQPNSVGALPRDSSYFRPLLTDIATTAARLKRQMLGVPNGRH